MRGLWAVLASAALASCIIGAAAKSRKYERLDPVPVVANKVRACVGRKLNLSSQGCSPMLAVAGWPLRKPHGNLQVLLTSLLPTQ